MKGNRLLLGSLLCLFVFVGATLAQDWTLSITVFNGSRTDSMVLTLGMDRRASNGFDLLDIPAFAPPSGFYAYFELNDPENPDVTMLGTDIRSSLESSVYWVGNVGGDMSTGDRLVKWSLENLPVAYGSITIGVANIGGSVSTWVDMSAVDTIAFRRGQQFQIHFVVAGAVDRNPPVVADWNPADGQLGVDPNTRISFNITDDVSGVDLDHTTVVVNGVNVTSLGTFTPIVGGYHFEYIPAEPFRANDTVRVRVSSRDLNDPPHIMEPVEIMFVIRSELPRDIFPPRVDFWQPADSSIGNSPATVIRARVTDTGTGVNSESITMQVNGLDVTRDLVIIPTGVHDNEYDIFYDYPGDYPENSRVVVVLSMEDLAGNPAIDTLTFWVGTAGIEAAWSSDIIIWSYTEGSDTVKLRLTFGEDPSARNGFDPYDVALPFAPPFGPYAFFPLSDPENPMITMLTTDIRAMTPGQLMWTVRCERPGTSTGVFWTDATLRGTGQYHIGAADPGETPTTWVDMSTTRSFSFTPRQLVYIRYNSGGPDSTAPYLISSTPANGERNVPLNQRINLEIGDVGTGVDRSTVVLVFDGDTVTGSVTFSPIPSGFRITYNPGPLLAYHTYDLIIYASDYAGNSSVIRISFITGSSTAVTPWQANITVFTVPASGDTETATLTFGVDPNGTNGYDPTLDVPIPMLPPSGLAAYFPLSDPDYPYYTMLNRDIRSSRADSVRWLIVIPPERLASGGTHGVKWNPSLLPALPDTEYAIEIGVASHGGNPTSWTNMRTTSRINFNAGQEVHLRVRTTPPPRYNITGTVRLQGATDFSGTIVSIPALGLSDTTDRGGNFSFLQRDRGTYTLVFEHEGYFPDTITVNLIDRNVTITDTLYLISYTVSGVVRIEGLSSGNWGGTTVRIGDSVYVTQPNGSYIIRGVLPGPHTITATHPGYATVETTVTVTSDMVVNLLIPAIGYTVSGTVNLEGDGNLAGTTVRIGTTVTTTDSTGHYSFTDVPAGLIHLIFTRAGFITVDTAIVVDRNITVNITLRRAPITITGTVNLAGAPGDLSGTRVQINAPGVEPVITGPSGQYTFADLPQGTYTITASHEYYATAETTITADRDITVNFTLIHLDGVRNLIAAFDTLYRPVPSGVSLCVRLRWNPPVVAGLTIEGYEILRGSDPLTLTRLANVDTVGYMDCTVVSGVTYYYAVVVIYTEGRSPQSGPVSVTPVILPDPKTVLVYDFDNGATPCDGGVTGAAEALAAVLRDLGITYTITEQDEPLDRYELSDYRAVFVVTGIYDAVSTRISPADLAKLERYLDSGGKVYVEGPDFAKDYTGTGFFARFKANFVSDGVDETIGNVQTIRGNLGFFGRYLTWNYAYRTQADRLVDIVSPVAPGLPMWASQDASGMYVVVRGVYTSNTAFSSCYTGGLVDGPAPVTRARYLAQILEWFGIRTTGVVETKAIPKNFALKQNFPNPFNPATTITVDLPVSSDALLEVYTITGEKVATLVNGRLEAGSHNIVWNATDNAGNQLPSGVYLCRLNAGSYTETIRMLLLR